MLLAESFSLENITSREVTIALMGLLIVFTALVLITTFIALLPKALEWLKDLLPPEGEHHHGAAAPVSSPDEEAVVVAVGVALHARLQHKSTE